MKKKTISYAKAYDAVMASIKQLGTEKVTLNDSLGRILAQDVLSDTDMPPFNKAAMDGYACRLEDLKNELEVIDNIPAGQLPKVSNIGLNQCAKIMTGAIVPDGADCVVMVEHTEETPEGKIKFCHERTAGNICFKGEDVAEGNIVLEKGVMITPAEIAVMASVGCVEPLVSVKPHVGVIATGSELVEPELKISGAMIRNSNSYQLCSQIFRAGGIPNYYGIAGDTNEAIDSTIKKAMSENDLIVLSGGVSMGDFDLVPGILKDNGFKFLFESVAMQPGRPTIFGTRENGLYCCGLPGNPVSTYIIFEILLKPFIHKLMGGNYVPKEVELALSKDLKRRNTKRRASVPVRLLPGGKAEPIDYHGSAHINAMCVADGIFPFQIGENFLPKGTKVNVRLFD